MNPLSLDPGDLRAWLVEAGARALGRGPTASLTEAATGLAATVLLDLAPTPGTDGARWLAAVDPDEPERAAHGGDPEAQAAGLLLLTGAAAVGPAPGLDARWAERVDDAVFDATARPGAWRHLSAFADALRAALGLPESHPGRAVLDPVARAALDAPSEGLRAAASRAREAARRTAWASAWRPVLVSSPRTAPLADALDALDVDTLPLAAGDEAPDALARHLLGAAHGGEVTVAVTAGGLLLEWDGDGPAPDRADLDGASLPRAADTASLSAVAWHLPSVPGDPRDVTLTRGEAAVALSWPGPA